jgi:hypothetical protein
MGSGSKIRSCFCSALLNKEVEPLNQHSSSTLANSSHAVSSTRQVFTGESSASESLKIGSMETSGKPAQLGDIATSYEPLTGDFEEMVCQETPK